MIRLLAVGNDPTIALPADSVPGDTYQRQVKYASILESYHLITKAPTGLVPSHIQIASNFWVYPCGPRNMADYLVSAVKTGWHIAKDQDVQVVSAQDPFLTGLVAYLIARRYMLPLSLHFVADALDNPVWIHENPAYSMLNHLAHWLIGKASTFRVVSTREKDKLIRLAVPPKSIWMLPSITDFGRFAKANGATLRKQWLGSSFRHILLCIARLAPQKDLHTLVRAMSRIVQRHPNALLVIVGDGPLRSQLQKWLADAGLRKKTLLLGTVPYQDLASHYAACDVFLLSSAYEGNARVLVEAAASAKPVVCTDVSGARDTVLDGDTGYIVPIGDDNALAGRSSELLAAPEIARQMGQRAREHITTLYDPGSILDGFRSLWEATARAGPC